MAKASGVAVKISSATFMKEITLTTKSVASVLSNGRQATTTRVSIKMRNEMAMEKCTGRMDPAIKVNGLEASSMDTEGCVSQTERRKKVISRITSTKSKSILQVQMDRC